MPRVRTALLAAILAAGLGCRRDATEPAPTGSASSSPAAAPSASASASAAPASAIVLHRVATAAEPVSVFDVVGAPMMGTGAFLARLGATGIVQDPALLLGLEGDTEIVSATGVFPEAAWLTIAAWSRTTGQISGRKIYRWRASRWTAAASPVHDAPPLGIAELGGDRTAALVTGDDGAPRVEIVRAMRHADVPALPGGEGSCARVVAGPGALLVGASDGTVTVLGSRCGGDAGPLAVSWRSAASWTVTALPRPAGRAVKLTVAASRGDEAWAGGDAGGAPYLAHFDGKQWSLVDAPLDAAIAALAIAKDGTLWLATATSVARHTTDGAWTRATTASGALDGVTSLVGESAEAAWIGTAGSAPALWSTRPRASVLAVPDRKTMWSVRSLTGRAIATDACSALWAPLSNIGKTGGFLPGDLPWLREGVRGHADLDAAAFVLDDDGSSVTIGAVVPTLEVGDRAFALFGERLGIAGAKVACHAPRVVRRYEFDRVTGEPKRRAK